MTTVMEACSSAIRGLIIAPPKKKLVIADLSNVEGRVLAWLAGETWKLRAFREYDTQLGLDGNWYPGDEINAAALRGAPIAMELNAKGDPVTLGHDLYKLAYAKAFGIDPADVDGFMRQIGKTMELALGFGGGCGAFITFSLAFNIDLEAMAEKAYDNIPKSTMVEAESFLEWQLGQGKSQFGLSDRAYTVCESFKRLWRESHPAISSYWKDLENTIRQAINNPGQTLTCRMHKVRRDGAWLRVMLPSGRYLCYPSPRVEDDGGITYMGVNQYSRKWERIRTYGGKVVENCIAEGTEVLTEKFGWLAIESVTPDSRVWDGDEWVYFSHCHYSGKQTTIPTYGVRMTPDHLVLTEEGWKNASSCGGHNRAACRLPDGYSVPGVGRQEVDLGSWLRLREGDSNGRLGVEETRQERDRFVVRLHAQSDNRPTQYTSRDDEPSGLLGLALNERSLQPTHAPSLQKLWCAGHRSLRTLAGKVRELLGRHGREIQVGADLGALGQLVRVFDRQLRLAYPQTSSEQYSPQPLDRHATRPHDLYGSLGVLRGGLHDAPVPPGPRMAGIASADTARVYDLVNCGPRSRFVVRGTDGLPLIVHNCTQAAARDVIARSMPRIEAWRP
ncbi:hypothetical protein D3C80_689090 [compost metagenome]